MRRLAYVFHVFALVATTNGALTPPSAIMVGLDRELHAVMHAQGTCAAMGGYEPDCAESHHHLSQQHPEVSWVAIWSRDVDARVPITVPAALVWLDIEGRPIPFTRDVCTSEDECADLINFLINQIPSLAWVAVSAGRGD